MNALRSRALDACPICCERGIAFICPVHPCARVPSWLASALRRLVWLGEEPAEPNELRELLRPYPSERMGALTRSARRVGNVKNDSPSLIEPLEASER